MKHVVELQCYTGAREPFYNRGGSRSKIKFYHTLIFTPPFEIVPIV